MIQDTLEERLLMLDLLPMLIAAMSGSVVAPNVGPVGPGLPPTGRTNGNGNGNGGRAGNTQ
jgi:hypothetical protein